MRAYSSKMVPGISAMPFLQKLHRLFKQWQFLPSGRANRRLTTTPQDVTLVLAKTSVTS